MATTATTEDSSTAKDTGAAKDRPAQKKAAAGTVGTGPAREAGSDRKAKAGAAAKSKDATSSKTGTAGKAEAKDSKPGGKQSPGPFGSLTGLRNEMNHMFDGFISGVGRAPALFRSYEPAWRLSRRRRMVAPAVDMIESGDAITLTAELPGLGEDDIELVLQDGMLTLRGEKASQREEKDDAYSLRERRYGAFERSFRMPDNANADKITATFEKGVLTVVVPCKAAANKTSKKITIEAK